MKYPIPKRYPRGRLQADDDGELRLAVGIKDSTIVIDFGKPVAWLGLGIVDAEALIAGLQEKVAQLKEQAA